MRLFDPYLVVWVGLGIAAGLGRGVMSPGLFETVAAMEWTYVNLVVAVFVWMIIYPLLVQIDFAVPAARAASRHPRLPRT